MPEVDTLFVYGTLLSGNRARTAYGHLFAGTARRAWTNGRLFHLPEGYPMLLLEPAEVPVQGEVVVLADPRAALPALDDYEGYDPATPEASLYVRQVVEVFTDDGAVEAWVYACPAFLRDDVVARGLLVEDGDWRGFLRRGRLPL